MGWAVAVIKRNAHRPRGQSILAQGNDRLMQGKNVKVVGQHLHLPQESSNVWFRTDQRIIVFKNAMVSEDAKPCLFTEKRNGITHFSYEGRGRDHDFFCTVSKESSLTESGKKFFDEPFELRNFKNSP